MYFMYNVFYVVRFTHNIIKELGGSSAKVFMGKVGLEERFERDKEEVSIR